MVNLFKASQRINFISPEKYYAHGSKKSAQKKNSSKLYTISPMSITLLFLTHSFISINFPEKN
jgi:hypothetical protein